MQNDRNSRRGQIYSDNGEVVVRLPWQNGAIVDLFASIRRGKCVN